MTTKAEFDAFIAGFKLAENEVAITIDQLDTILGKVDEVIAYECLEAVKRAAMLVPVQAPVVADRAKRASQWLVLSKGDDAEIVQRTRPAVDADPAPEPAPEPAVAVPEQVEESRAPVDPAPAPEAVASDAQQAVTDVARAPCERQQILFQGCVTARAPILQSAQQSHSPSGSAECRAFRNCRWWYG